MIRKIYLTPQGLAKIKKEYESLKKLLKMKIKGEKVPAVFSSDDINPEFLAFKDDVYFLQTRLTELESIINNAEVIKIPPKEEQNIVRLGAIVTLEEEDGKLNEFMLVESLEASPNEGKISIESPLGKALFGKKIGDEVNIPAPIKISYKIRKIRYDFA